MKLSSIVCASILALAATAFVAGGASAATTIKGSKSNGSEKIGTEAGTTEADCTKNKGTVSKDKDGNQICTLPETAQPVAATTVHGSKSNSSEKTGTTQPAPSSTPQ